MHICFSSRCIAFYLNRWLTCVTVSLWLVLWVSFSFSLFWAMPTSVCPFLFTSHIVSLGLTPRSGMVHTFKILCSRCQVAFQKDHAAFTPSHPQGVRSVSFPFASLLSWKGAWRMQRERQPGPCRPQSCILAWAFFSWAASGHLVSELRQGWLALWTARGLEWERTASSGIILWYWCCGSSLEIFIRADCQPSSGLGQCRQSAEPVRWGSLNLLI